jgi:Kef-type K+ transport system membrane component KefB
MDLTALAVGGLATLADEGPDTMADNISSLLVIAIISASVPIVVGLLRLKIAEVVLLLGCGIVFGPQGLGAIDINNTTETFNELGLGLLFFLAGFELEPEAVRGRSGKLATSGWFTSLALAFLLTFGFWKIGLVSDLAGIAIALTSTALGTLLPVVRDRGLLHTPFGTYFQGAGALGEFGPILAIALLLGSRSLVITLITLAVFAAVAALIYRAPSRLMTERIGQIMERGHYTSSQTALRWTVVLMLFLLGLAALFDLDAVLGAFVAGVLLRRFAPPGPENKLAPKIEALGFGFFIPLFFVMSGAKLDIDSIVENPGRLLLFFVLLLVVRGLPQFVLYRFALPDTRERWQFTLYVATALPILVAITGLEVSNGVMLPENAAALVGAGALSVLVFPLLGDRLNRRELAQPEVREEAAEARSTDWFEEPPTFDTHG